ncbi:uncharacterized protein TRIREDRAFT_110207 [Trichoderma reesei QM6a]|uniref:Predicted protein n=1 Tax=Hypocrea jecorina (strain QM6a) TaxID=431241 RepID=G0RRH3_HYPJQ|nr:uncharacterized protein TRIREDRAFT_110207 [Trichoderma reesei QM6a]EGR46152.1 predicted protein [Trichoderma reesei QM6a]
MAERRAEWLFVHGKRDGKSRQPATPRHFKRRFLTAGVSKSLAAAEADAKSFQVLNQYAHNAGRVTVFRKDLRLFKARMQNPSSRAPMSDSTCHQGV